MKEALKLALEALESSNNLINGTGNHFGLEGAMDGYYSGCFDVDGNNKLLNKAITAVKAALAQQEPVVGTKTWFEDDKVVTQYLTAKDIYKEPEQERNFCSRCGKRTADLTVIHTCTPPQENA